MSTEPNYLRLEAGETYTVALKYLEPQKVKGFAGPELRWILTNGKALYTPVSFRERVQELGVRVGEKFLIERRNGEVSARHLPDHCAEPRQAALLLEHAEELLEPEGSFERRTNPLEIVLSEAVQIALKGEEYSRSIGRPVQFTGSDIARFGIALYELRKRKTA